MLKFIRFTLIPIEVNYRSCPFQRPPLSTVNTETVAVVCDDMKRGLIQAYRTLTADYNDPQTDFKEVPYISPRLGYVMESVRKDPPPRGRCCPGGLIAPSVILVRLHRSAGQNRRLLQSRGGHRAVDCGLLRSREPNVALHSPKGAHGGALHDERAGRLAPIRTGRRQGGRLGALGHQRNGLRGVRDENE